MRLESLSAGLAAVWLATVGYGVYEEIAPLHVKKRIAITIKDQGKVQILFSNAQPHNEIIYVMKTEWIPKLEAAPKAFVGKTITEPFDLYIARRTQPALVKFGLIALLPPTILAVVVLLLRRKPGGR